MPGFTPVDAGPPLRLARRRAARLQPARSGAHGRRRHAGRARRRDGGGAEPHGDHARRPRFVRVYPCGSPPAARSRRSTSRPRGAGQHRRRAGRGNGTVCLQANVDVDIASTCSATSAAPAATTSSRCRRCACSTAASPSRPQPGHRRRPVAAGQVVRLASPAARACPPAPRRRRSTSPASTSARLVLTAYPCGDRPLASNVNITPEQQVTANGAMVKLSRRRRPVPVLAGTRCTSWSTSTASGSDATPRLSGSLAMQVGVRDGPGSGRCRRRRPTGSPPRPSIRPASQLDRPSSGVPSAY